MPDGPDHRSVIDHETAALLAKRMPWTAAEPGSWWVVTGRKHERHTFTDCIARVLPPGITGGVVPLFEVLVYGDTFAVPASSITQGRRLILAWADDPTMAYYEQDQAFIDRALDWPSAVRP